MILFGKTIGHKLHVVYEMSDYYLACLNDMASRIV